MSLANKINYFMLQIGVTQAELSKHTQIERSTITKILNGSTTQPRLETLTALAHYFKIDVSELLDPLQACTAQTLLQNNGIAKIIKSLMKIRGISTIKDLGEKSGVPNSVISDILNEKTINPNLKTLQHLANFFNITVPQLTGIEQLPELQTLQPVSQQINIPVLSFNQIKDWIAGTCDYPHNTSYVITNIENKDSKLYALSISGNSFFPDIFFNEMLIIDPNVNSRKGDIVICELNKRIISLYEEVDCIGDTLVLREAGTKTKISIPNNDTIKLGTVIQRIINRGVVSANPIFFPKLFSTAFSK